MQLASRCNPIANLYKRKANCPKTYRATSPKHLEPSLEHSRLSPCLKLYEMKLETILYCEPRRRGHPPKRTHPRVKKPKP
jgi:hypothetical protein